MSTKKITADVLDAFLYCKTKAHFREAGERGVRTEYEGLLLSRRDETKHAAIQKILASHGEEDVARSVPATVDTLKAGPAIVLDALYENELFCLKVDGLKKVPGASRLGSFHYVPVLFHGGEKLSREQRLTLELHALLLAEVQALAPSHGIVYHSKDCRGSRVALKPGRAEQLLRQLRRTRDPEPPKLILNDHCQMCEFRQRCHDQAVREDNLSLLRGMSEKEVKKAARKGIFTVTQLSHTFRPRRKGKRKTQKARHYHTLQALAIREKKVFVFGTPELPDSPVRVYLDVESDPDEGYVYLIGMVLVQHGTETRFSFWANSKEQEQAIFEQMLEEISRFENFQVFCYGSYEQTFLKRMRKAARRKKAVNKVLAALVNTLSVVYAHVYFPCYSNGLKDVGRCLGGSWSEPDASGIQSVVWRKRWEATREEQWKQKLTTYNLEDCEALRAVTDFLLGLCHQERPADAAEGTPRVPPVAAAEDIPPSPEPHEWFRRNSFLPDFDFINRRAFFDYQRDKVYIRTNEDLKRLRAERAKAKKGRKQAFPRKAINKRIDTQCKKCPHCKSRNIYRPSQAQVHSKHEVHLQFTSRGVIRHVTEYQSQQFRCRDCSRRFLPARLKERKRRDKYSHAFKSWVIYLHLTHRISFDGIHDMAREFFGVSIYHAELYTFQAQMACYYRPTYNQILTRITSGQMLHADETSAGVRGANGYVWVLATMQDVAYQYHQTRDGDAIRSLLRDFRGVLITDFFASYDVIACTKQRCLIHLIRDFNDDLLANPYDDELRCMTDEFATLLKSIVQTIDRQGLKQRYLAGHEQDVERFFNAVAGRDLVSEVAQKYQQRFARHRNELFTFLRHDGVPWNNNNAEYAVKCFAQYRTIAENVMTERGLNDYLVLLSVQQTCQYRGISFIQFLRSGEKDIVRYSERLR
jgi:predicted RecB family nuclease